jgi:Arc/MetJ-type ribon-helix-helix transcriptional regulator
LPKKTAPHSGRVDYQPIAIPREIIKMIDTIIADGRFTYVSRNDFVRDAVRRRIEEISRLMETEIYKKLKETPKVKAKQEE